MTTATSDIEKAIFDDIESAMVTQNPVEWTNRNRSIKGKEWEWVYTDYTTGGRPATKDFRYLLPIYRDQSEAIIFKKSRQMAISEYAINWIMSHVVEIPGITAVHVFPNEAQGKKFSMVRLTPILDKKSSPRLARMLKNPDYKDQTALQAAMNVYHKQFTNMSNYILSFVGGANTKSTDARSISADIIFLDEAKDLPQEKITDVLECMSLSSIRKYRMAGTPDYEGTEFDRRYEESDQMEWVVTCKHCASKQILDFEKNIRARAKAPFTEIMDSQDKYYYACVSCGAELDRTADYAEWIPQNPGARVRGYHLTQLMASWITADDIMYKKSDNVKYPYKFYNEVLGQTYSGGSKPITFSKLLRCRGRDEGTNFKYITIGVDWGNQSHYVILGSNGHTKYHVLDFGTWEDPIVLRHAYKVVDLNGVWSFDKGVLDSGYGKAQNQEVFKALPEKFYSCFYKEGAFKPIWETIDSDQGLLLPPKDYQYHVTTNHTSLCDNVMTAIDNQKLSISFADDDDLVPGVSEMRDFLDNMCLARIAEAEVKGKTKRKWVITKAHYFAALSYAMLAMDQVLEENGIEGDGAIGFFDPRSYR